MKWDLYERNLLYDRHVRYGGIGYYHVSDTYVALFSHFIPCGVWEAVYILDGVLKNRSDIQPDTVHADTQVQSTPVFGLAYWLGIELMHGIRNWKRMKLLRSPRTSRYKHIDLLFPDVIDWPLIETNLADLLRLDLSIRSPACHGREGGHREGGHSECEDRTRLSLRVDLDRQVHHGHLGRSVG